MRNIFYITVALLMINPVYAVEWSGYYEGQLTGYSLRDTAVWQQTNRLRLDLSADLGSDATVAADIVAMTYYGETSLNLLDVLPKAETEQIRQLLGVAADQVFTFNYEATEFSLDNAFISFYPGSFTFRIGRQQLPWGTGYAWNPTDVFNVKSLMDPTYEKPGNDALKAEWGFGESGSITAVVIPGVTWQETTKVGRIKVNIQGFDISSSYIQQAYDAISPLSMTSVLHETRSIIGADVVGQIMGAGIWSEGAWFKGPGENEEWQLVVGLENTFEFQTTIIIEYYRDSDGEANSVDYTLSDWIDLGLGMRKTLGRDYLMVMATHPLTALLTGTIMAVNNLNDQSVIIIPTLEYSYSDNLTLSLTGNVFTGPGKSEYGQLKGGAGYIRLKAFY